MRPELPLRRLTPEEAGLYREIRLEALRTNPEAFSSSFAFEERQAPAWFADRLERSPVFAVFDGVRPLGIAGFYLRPGKRVPTGVLWGMYVRPPARRAGIGRRLVAAVVEHARAAADLIELGVMPENRPARALYSRLGFTEYALCRNPPRPDGRSGDEVLMAMAFTASGRLRLGVRSALYRAFPAAPRLAVIALQALRRVCARLLGAGSL